PEEAMDLVGLGRFGQRGREAAPDDRRVVEFQQQRAKAVAEILVDPVIDLQPTMVSLEQLRTTTNLVALPTGGATLGHNPVITPMDQVGRCGRPNDRRAK